jgi:hypothetical protein
MNVSVKNLTANPLSTDVGLLNPGETKAMTMGPAAAYRAAEGLKTLSDAGRVEVTISEETDKLDDLEPATVGTASVADGTVTTAKLEDGVLAASASGRAKMATNFFNEATVDAKFAAGAINGLKLKDASITTAKYGSGSVDATALGSGAVTTAKLGAGAVDTAALGANAVTSAKLDPQIAQVSADVTVSTGELLALNATPKTLISAPGDGKAIIFEGAVLFLDYNSVAYNGIAAGEDLSFKYTNSSGLAVAGCETTGFLDQTADTMRYVRPTTAASGVSDQVVVNNAALVLHLLTGEIATGNSPLKVRVYYRVVPTTL